MKDIAPAIWFYALTIGLMLSLRGPLGPRRLRSTHHVRFSGATGFPGFFARWLRYETVRVDRRTLDALSAALTAGAPQERAVRIVAASIFYPAWWHVGPFHPVNRVMALEESLQLEMLTLLSAPAGGPRVD